jgi:hypothetical protein
MQFSTDGYNWDITQVFNLTGGDFIFAQMPVQAQYFRLKYTNGPVAQTYFRVQTILHPTATIGATVRVGDTINTQTPAQLTRSVLAGEDNLGVFKNVGITQNQRLKISQSEVLEGDYYTYTNGLLFAGNETAQFLIIPPPANSTRHVHFSFEQQGEDTYSLEFYDDATCSFEGTIVTNPRVVNRNMNYPDMGNREFRIKASPTVVNKGSLIQRFIGPKGAKTTGSIALARSEIILRNGVLYLVEIKNLSANAQYISWVADFIDHEWEA